MQLFVEHARELGEEPPRASVPRAATSSISSSFWTALVLAPPLVGAARGLEELRELVRGHARIALDLLAQLSATSAMLSGSSCSSPRALLIVFALIHHLADSPTAQGVTVVVVFGDTSPGARGNRAKSCEEIAAASAGHATEAISR